MNRPIQNNWKTMACWKKKFDCSCSSWLLSSSSTMETSTSPSLIYIKYSGWNAPNNVTDCDMAYLNALARLGIRLPVSMYRRRHWLNRNHRGRRHIKGMAMFLYQNCWLHEWSYFLASLSCSRKSPDATKQNDQNKSWNTLTILENYRKGVWHTSKGRQGALVSQNWLTW